MDGCALRDILKALMLSLMAYRTVNLGFTSILSLSTREGSGSFDIHLSFVQSAWPCFALGVNRSNLVCTHVLIRVTKFLVNTMLSWPFLFDLMSVGWYRKHICCAILPPKLDMEHLCRYLPCGRPLTATDIDTRKPQSKVSHLRGQAKLRRLVSLADYRWISDHSVRSKT